MEFGKPGVYDVKEDLHVKIVLICIDSKTTHTYPIMTTAIIPKNSKIVHARKYLSMSSLHYDNYKVEVPNDMLRTDKVIFTKIRRHHPEDECYITYGNILKTNFQENIEYTMSLNTNIEHQYGDGLYFSLDEAIVKKYFDSYLNSFKF